MKLLILVTILFSFLLGISAECDIFTCDTTCVSNGKTHGSCNDSECTCGPTMYCPTSTHCNYVCRLRGAVNGTCVLKSDPQYYDPRYDPKVLSSEFNKVNLRDYINVNFDVSGDNRNRFNNYSDRYNRFNNSSDSYTRYNNYGANKYIPWNLGVSNKSSKNQDSNMGDSNSDYKCFCGPLVRESVCPYDSRRCIEGCRKYNKKGVCNDIYCECLDPNWRPNFECPQGATAYCDAQCNKQLLFFIRQCVDGKCICRTRENGLTPSKAILKDK